MLISPDAPSPDGRTVQPGRSQSPGPDTASTNFIPATNAVESLNARLRRAVKASGHFPTELAALKRLYLAILSLDPTGKAPQRWSNRWKPALNALEMAFDGRLHPERDTAAGVKTSDTP